MEFRTEFKPKASLIKIDLKDSIVTIGSCFSDDIGQRLIDNKFNVCKNPFGTVYNPISIHKLLEYSAKKSPLSLSGFLERDKSYFHYDFHSNWNDHSKEALNEKLNREISNVHNEIKNCKHLIITYGTSWVYKEKNSREIVANCHKIPQGNFEKFLLTQKRILESFKRLYQELKSLNKELRIILTVSPVRHIKDTTELNSVSKSILRLTCHTLSEAYSEVEYFPSYEIMMDDLRDYRFYKSDLIHPTELALDYIWEKFGESYFGEETVKFILEWSKVKGAINHKSFHPKSDAHQQFLKETLIKLDQLKFRIDVSREVGLLKDQISEVE